MISLQTAGLVMCISYTTVSSGNNFTRNECVDTGQAKIDIHNK
jgi:hypothetical protein